MPFFVISPSRSVPLTHGSRIEGVRLPVDLLTRLRLDAISQQCDQSGWLLRVCRRGSARGSSTLFLSRLEELPLQQAKPLVRCLSHGRLVPALPIVNTLNVSSALVQLFEVLRLADCLVEESRHGSTTSGGDTLSQCGGPIR